jgi:hypothetical protein
VFVRIVLFKLTESWSSPEGRTRLARALSSAVPRRDGVLSLEAGLPADAAAEKSWDLLVTLRFDSVEGSQHLDALALVARVTGVPHADVVALHKTWTFRPYAEVADD